MTHRFICLLILLFFGVGCAASPPARFYLLNAPDLEQDKPQALHSAEQISLQVQVPEYVDRPQIVIRKGEHRLFLSELDRWAEPLSRMITRVVSQELATGPVPVQVNTPGSPGDDVRIWIQILQLDGAPGDTVRLKANWRIADPGKDWGEVRFFTQAVSVPGTKMDDLVRAHERIVTKLAREIRGVLERGIGGARDHET